MRLLHTADWHLGKQLGGFSLLEEQRLALEGIAELAHSADVAAVLIAGDVYDRAVPPTEAIHLLEWFLEEVAVRQGRAVIVTSGNHDNAERLGFGARLMAEKRVHLRTRFSDRLTPVELAVGDERALVFTLPFLDPEEVRLSLGDAAVVDHDSAVRAALVPLRAAEAASASGPRPTRVLMAHLFCVGGFESPDSERPVAVGTAGHVSPSSLGGFDYVALGHLHRPQRVAGDDAVRYAGSLLKYSAAEASQPKSVTLVHLERGGVRAEDVPSKPLRDLVVLEAPFAALATSPKFAAHTEDFVVARYTDAAFVLDAAPRLRERFPRLLQCLPQGAALSEDPSPVTVRRTDAPRELLKEFWAYAGVPHALEEAHLGLLEDVLHGADTTEDGA